MEAASGPAVLLASRALRSGIVVVSLCACALLVGISDRRLIKPLKALETLAQKMHGLDVLKTLSSKVSSNKTLSQLRQKHQV